MAGVISNVPDACVMMGIPPLLNAAKTPSRPQWPSCRRCGRNSKPSVKPSANCKKPPASLIQHQIPAATPSNIQIDGSGRMTTTKRIGLLRPGDAIPSSWPKHFAAKTTTCCIGVADLADPSLAAICQTLNGLAGDAWAAAIRFFRRCGVDEATVWPASFTRPSFISRACGCASGPTGSSSNVLSLLHHAQSDNKDDTLLSAHRRLSPPASHFARRPISPELLW